MGNIVTSQDVDVFLRSANAAEMVVALDLATNYPINVPSLLGYTPANKAGETFGGAIAVPYLTILGSPFGNIRLKNVIGLALAVRNSSDTADASISAASATLSSALTVTSGNTVLGGLLSVTGAVDMASTLTVSGTGTFTGTLGSYGNVTALSPSLGFYLSGMSAISSAAVNTIALTGYASGAFNKGVTLNLSTDGTLALKNRANNADAALTVGSVTSSSIIQGQHYYNAASGEILWYGRAGMSSPADGQLKVENSTHTAAFTLDLTGYYTTYRAPNGKGHLFTDVTGTNQVAIDLFYAYPQINTGAGNTQVLNFGCPVKFNNSVTLDDNTYDIGQSSSGRPRKIYTVGLQIENQLTFKNTGYLTTVANGQFKFHNAADTAGVGFDVTTDGTLKLRSKTFDADASLTAGAGTFSGDLTVKSISDTSSGLSRLGYPYKFYESLAFYHNSYLGSAIGEQVLFNQYTTQLVSNHIVSWSSGTHYYEMADLKYLRNSAGQMDIRGDNGLRIRNLANSADAPLTAGAGTFSGAMNGTSGSFSSIVTASGGVTSGGRIYVNSGSATAPQNTFLNANDTGPWLVSTTAGSRAYAISTDGAEAVRFGGSGVSRAATFAGPINLSGHVSAPKIYVETVTGDLRLNTYATDTLRVNFGAIAVNSNIDGSMACRVRANATTSRCLVAQAITSQTTNVLDVLDTVGGTLFGVSTSGSAIFASHVTQGWQSSASDPTTSDIPSGSSRMWKNTTNGEIRLWVNDGGTMKKSAALT